MSAFIPGERVVEAKCDAMGVGTVIEYHHRPVPVCIVQWDMLPGTRVRIAADRLTEADPTSCECGWRAETPDSHPHVTGCPHDREDDQ